MHGWSRRTGDAEHARSERANGHVSSTTPNIAARVMAEPLTTFFRDTARC
jgi:hypothetical protein